MIPAISFIINVGVFELCQWVYVGNLQKAKSRTACAHSPCSDTQGHNSCQKAHGVSRKHIWFIFPLFLCHVTFRQLLLTPSFSCTWSHAHSLTHSPLFLYLALVPHCHFNADLSDDVIFSIITRLFFGWAGADPQRERGFHMGWAVTFFLST